MNKNVIIISVLLGFLFITGGCKKKDIPVQAIVVTNDISGNVKLFDVYGTAVKNNSGVTVKAAESSITATTDSLGNWTLKDMPANTYTISLSKWGYGTWRVMSYKFTADEKITLNTDTLCQTPSYGLYNLNEMTQTSITDTVKLIGFFNGTPPSGERYIRLFIGSAVDVSYNPAKYLFSVLVTLPASAQSFACNINSYMFKRYGLTSGQNAYIIAYPESSISTSYNDPATGRLWYPNISTGKSNTLGVSVP